MFTYQGEELNHQHFLLGIASTTLLCEALLIAYVRKHKFDIIDVSIFVAYLYFIFMNEYNNALSDKSDIYSVQLFFVLYFAFRIILHCFHVKYILICLLAVTEIFQSLVGTGQFLGILDSRHTSFSVTGTFLNPGPFGIFLAVLGVIMVLHIISNYSLFAVYRKQDTQYDKTAMLFRPATYCHSPESVHRARLNMHSLVNIDSFVMPASQRPKTSPQSHVPAASHAA